MTRQRVVQLQRTQWAVQARLNAQSGFNQFCVAHQAPAPMLDMTSIESDFMWPLPN